MAMRQRTPGLSLLLTIFKINFPFRAWWDKPPAKKLGGLLLFLLILLSLLPLEKVLFSFFLLLSQTSLVLGQPALVPVLITVAGQMMVLVFGIFYLLPTFYFSQDINRMLHLPLRPRQLLAAKFLVVMAGEVLTLAIFFLPGLLAYGLVWEVGPIYWLLTFFIWLTLPLLPLSLDAIITMLFARVVSFANKRDFLRILGSFLVLPFVIGWQFFSRRFYVPGGGGYSLEEVEVIQGLAAAIGSKFPPALWAARALASPDTLAGWLNLALFILISLVFLGLTALVAEKIFFQDLKAGQEVSRRRGPAAVVNLQPAGLKTALWRREFKLFLRTPVFAMNGLFSILLVPLMMLVPLLAAGELREVISLVRQPQIAAWVALGGAALTIFLSTVNQVAPTSISREGRLFWLLQVLPVEAKLWVRTKLAFSLLFAALGAVIVAVTLFFVLQLSPLALAITVVLGLLGSWPLAVLGLIVDLAWPRLDWVDPQQAMKGNFNGLIAMVLGGLLLGLSALAGYFLFRWGWGYSQVLIVLALELAVIGVIMTFILDRLATKRFRQIGA